MTQTLGLYEYGIHTEQSDIRAHVSVANKTIYVFQTANGLEAIQKHCPPLKKAYQKGFDTPTAEGWLVKVEWIEDLRRVRYQSWPRWAEVKPDLPTTEKGSLAVQCVLDAMKLGRFPLWLDAEEQDDVDVQRAGTDILIAFRKKIQVKCDYQAGDKPEGTGNLFLQKAEHNPFKLH